MYIEREREKMDSEREKDQGWCLLREKKGKGEVEKNGRIWHLLI